MGWFQRRKPTAPKEGSMHAIVIEIQRVGGGWSYITIRSVANPNTTISLATKDLMGLQKGMEATIYWQEERATDGSMTNVMTAVGGRLRAD